MSRIAKKRVWVNCDWCGKPFSLSEAEHRKRLKRNKCKRMFHSDACYLEYHRANKVIKVSGLEVARLKQVSDTG